MHPSVIDQLNGVKRVLKEVIRPGLSSDYERDVLHWSVRVLSLAIDEVPLAHSCHLYETEAILRLLKRVLPELNRLEGEGWVPAALVKAVCNAIRDGSGDPADLADAERRVHRLRDVAAELAKAQTFQIGGEVITDAFEDYVRDLSQMLATKFKLKNYAQQA